MKNIQKKYGLLLILLHGSNVTGKIHNKSDVDIAVVRKNPNKKLDFLALLSDLKKEFNSDDIDLADITRANPLFLYAVMRKSKLLSGKKDDYDKILNLAFHKYSDYLPYLKKESKFIRERVDSYVAN